MRCSLMPCNALKTRPRMLRRPRKLTKLNIFNFEIWVLFDFNDSRIIFYIHIVKTGATFIIRAVRTVGRARAGRTAMKVNCVMSLDYICYTFYMHSTYIFRVSRLLISHSRLTKGQIRSKVIWGQF